MKRKVVSIAAWLVATAVSIVLATAAVGNVGWGGDRPALQATVSSVITLPPTTSTTALGIGPSASTVEPSTTLAATTSTTNAISPDSTAPTTTAVPTTSTTPPPTTAQAPPTSTTTTVAPPTTTQPPPGDYYESFQLVGGWVRLRVSGDNVYLAAYVPENGFTVEVEHDGPESVEIEFRSESHDSKLHARVHDGNLDVDKDEEGEDD